MTSEIILWSRVLLQAMWDLAGIRANLPKRELPRLQRRTRAWFLSREESLGSFIWICHILSLEPDAVRSRVLSKSKAELVALAADDAPTSDADSPVDSSTEEMKEMDSEVA
jgi:hypothetical protein